MTYYYVTIIRGGRSAALAGPFSTHKAALDMVDEAKKKALEYSAFHAFDSFGTASSSCICKTWLGGEDLEQS